jgi:hypothetical protein
MQVGQSPETSTGGGTSWLTERGSNSTLPSLFLDRLRQVRAIANMALHVFVSL